MIKRLDNSLLLAIIALIGVGLVQIYSSSFIFATESYGDGLYFFKKQLAFSVISFLVLITTAFVPWKYFQKFGWMIWLFAAFAVAATFIPGVGVRVGGALRWLQLPFGVRFEPSELLKLSFSFLFATLLVQKTDLLSSYKWISRFVLFLVPLLLLLKQPDFGSFAIISFVAMCLLFAFGMRIIYFVGAVAATIPAFYVLVMSVPYRKARVMAFLDPWSDPAQKGFQVIQSMISFSKGGLTGVGLGEGQGKLFFLPEAHTDFTLAILGEEIGFIGFVLVLALYGFVVFRGIQIAIQAQSEFRKAVALGVTLTFGLSVFINAGVVMGLLPTKGLTLPFLSYGGSSLIVLCFAFGVLLNIDRSEVEERVKWK